MNDQQRQDIELAAQNWAKSNATYYVDTRQIEDTKRLSPLVSVSDMEAFHIVPLAIDADRIDFGYTATTDRSRLKLFQDKFPGKSCNFYGISEPGFEELVARIDATSLQIDTSDGFKELGARVLAAHKDDAFRLLAQLAYQLKASDIHIEPKAQEARVRFRLDGVLHQIMTLPSERYNVLLTSLQNQANMKWGSGRPQGGRLNLKLVDAKQSKQTVSLRIETIPTIHGEEIIVRLLSLDVAYLSLDKQNLRPDELRKIRSSIQRSQGMILAVGPTGSGKTSTLYAMVAEINSPDVKVVTLEDPIEYELADASQVAVASDKDELFAEKLRAVMRQDPNIIMIGEIRDQDTARTSLQAALTGHLVLSTFHASSAAAAINRLLDMIDGNPLMTSAITLIQAQRLLRRVCPNCRVQRAATPAEAKEIKASLEGLPSDIYKPQADMKLVTAKGCAKCNNFGYLGRLVVIEQLLMTPKLQELLASPQKTSGHAIEALARSEGMVTLMQNGLLQALAGQTTLEEVHKNI